MPAAAAAPTRKYHPQMFMRDHWRYTGRVPNTAWGGVGQYINVLQLGYAGMLVVRVSGQYDIAVGGSALNALAPYNAVKRFDVQPPGGAKPWSTSGWGTKMLNLVDRDFAPFITGLDSEGVVPTLINGVTRNATTDEAFPNVANTPNQVFQLWYVIPFHRSAYDLRGLLPTGGPSPVQLWVYPAALADIFATPANLANATFVVDVWQQVYEPAPQRADIAQFDARWIWQTEEYQNQQGVPAVGDNLTLISPHDTIFDIVHTLTLNGAQDSADIANVTLKIDDTYYADHLDRRLWDKYTRGLCGRALPLGLVWFPFDRLKDADGAVAAFDPYYGLSAAEWLVADPARVANIRSILNISGGVAGTSNLWTVIRRLVRVTG